MEYFELSIFNVFSITSENFFNLSDLEGNLESFLATELTGMVKRQELINFSLGILLMIFLISSNNGCIKICNLLSISLLLEYKFFASSCDLN